MQLQSPFNAQQFDPTQGGTFQQLPLGKHPVKIVASEIKATADNSGGMIVFELEVIDGPAKGSHGPMRINLYSSSDKARAIAESQFSALCHATGVFMVQDTSQLHEVPFAVDVEAQSLTPQQVEKQQQGQTVTPFTQVRKILDINGNEPKGGAAAPAQGGQAAWGGAAPAQAPAAAPAPAAGGWGGGGGQVQTPAASAPAPAAAPAAQWSQSSAPAGGAPAWGKR